MSQAEYCKLLEKKVKDYETKYGELTKKASALVNENATLGKKNNYLERKLAHTEKCHLHFKQLSEQLSEDVESITVALRVAQNTSGMLKAKNDKWKAKLKRNHVQVKYLIKEAVQHVPSQSELTKTYRKVLEEKRKEAEDKEIGVVAQLLEQNMKLTSEKKTTNVLLELSTKLQKETNVRVDDMDRNLKGSMKMVKELTLEGEKVAKASVEAIEVLQEERDSLAKKLAEMKQKLKEAEASASQKECGEASTPTDPYEKTFTGKWKLVRLNGTEDFSVPQMCEKWTKGTLVYKLEGDVFRSDVLLEDVSVPEMLVRFGELTFTDKDSSSTTVKRDGGLVTEGTATLRGYRSVSTQKYFITRNVENGQLRINAIVGNDVATYFFERID